MKVSKEVLSKWSDLKAVIFDRFEAIKRTSEIVLFKDELNRKIVQLLDTIKVHTTLTPNFEKHFLQPQLQAIRIFLDKKLLEK